MAQCVQATAQAMPIAITDSLFMEGYESGILWAKHGDMAELSDAIIVQYVHDNVLGEAFNPPVDDSTVARHTAFLVGWVVGMIQA